MGKVPVFDEPAIKAAVIEWIAEGRTLSAFCRRPGMPTRRSINYWKLADPPFKTAFLEARDEGFDALAELLIEVVMGVPLKELDLLGRGIQLEIIEEKAQHRRLIADTILKLLAKWDPRRYGERLDLQHSGQIGIDAVIGETLNRKKPAES